MQPDLVEPVRCEELWYEDGNLVIQAGNTLFKVHRGILCDNSSVFEDMFKLPQSDLRGDSETFEGHPYIQLHDSSQEMKYFLLALFKSGTFCSPSKPFCRAIACARLGTKYDVDHVRLFGLRLLRKAFPLSFYAFKFPMDLNTLPFEPPVSPTPALVIALETIKLARQLDLLDLLPAAYATVASMPVDVMMAACQGCDNTATLIDNQAIVLCLKIRESFIVAQTRIVVHVASARCLEGCDAQFDKLYNVLLHKAHTPFDCNPIVEGLCKPCGSSFQQKIRQIRQQCWDRIPEICGLPCWAKLQARRGEDEMNSPTLQVTNYHEPHAMPENPL